MQLAQAVARRVRSKPRPYRVMRVFGDTCNAALCVWERSLMVPRSAPAREADKAA